MAEKAGGSKAAPGGASLVKRAKRLVDLALARVNETNIVEIASTMTLATVISIVPLLAVLLAVFSAVPAFESYRAEFLRIIAEFVPAEHSGEITEYLKSFSGHAAGLSAFGFAGLAVSAFFLIDKMFKTINKVFRVRRGRPFAQKAAIYWALLTLGPFVVVVSVSVSTYLAKMALAGLPSGFSGYGLKVFSFLFQGLCYSALFYAIPNCIVKRRDALAGGFFTAACGLVLKWGFSIYIGSGTLASLYGAFVALPVFILWIYATWLLIFTGAGVTATLPMITSGRFADSYKHGNDFATAVTLLSVLMRQKAAGTPVVPVSFLCGRADSWPEAVSAVMEKLADIGYASHVSDPRTKTDSWVLIADERRATLEPVFSALSLDPSIKLIANGAGEGSWYEELRGSIALNKPLEEVL